jgi:hypothetical protein
MIKLGPKPADMREMSSDDIFISRLKLLIIMVKAYLIGYPLGKYQKRAIIENTHYVFYRAMQMNAKSQQKGNQIFASRTDVICTLETSARQHFYQRVQLLAVIAKALAEGYPTGNFRIRAINENLDKICEIFLIDFQLNDVSFLKVA